MSNLNVDQYLKHTAVGRAISKAEAMQQVRWNLPIDHWSPSSLDMLNRCPYQWQQRYLKGRKERPAEATTTGTAVHKAVERNYRQKVDSHIDLPVVDLTDWYMSEGFLNVVAEEQERAGEEVLWDTSPDEARQRGGHMLAEYHVGVAPRIQPLAAEGVIEVDLGAPVPVQGRFDVERIESVIDVKTGKRTQKKPKESWRIQAAVYGEARGKPVEFHHVSATSKSSAVSIVTPLESEALFVHPSPDERAEMVRSIRALSAWACLLYSIHGPDEDWPAMGRFHTWACDYCGFRSGCPAWKGAA